MVTIMVAITVGIMVTITVENSQKLRGRVR
jgi:hypothetical protein